MRLAFIAAQLLWPAPAASDAGADEPLAQVGSSSRRRRHVLVWGAVPLLALVALATVVNRLT
jgi:hypothetical protein